MARSQMSCCAALPLLLQMPDYVAQFAAPMPAQTLLDAARVYDTSRRVTIMSLRVAR